MMMVRFVEYLQCAVVIMAQHDEHRDA